MKVLVTGGGGFIGSQVVKLLLERNFDVRVFHLPNENLTNIEGLELERVSGDIRNLQDVRNAVKGCQQVYHLAAVYALWLPRMDLIKEVNIGGTHNVLDACLEFNVERVVYTSSIAAFGGQGILNEANENSRCGLLKTGDEYIISKYESHQVALEYYRRGLNLVICAPTLPLGPGDIGPTPTGTFLLSTVQYPLIPAVSTSNNFGDVRDVAMGHILAAEKGIAGESYLLGNVNLSYSDFTEIVMKVIQQRRKVLNVSPSSLSFLSKVAWFICDRYLKTPPLITPAGVEAAKLGMNASIDKAKSELGYNPRPIEETIADGLKWFARKGYINNRDMINQILAVC